MHETERTSKNCKWRPSISFSEHPFNEEPKSGSFCFAEFGLLLSTFLDLYKLVLRVNIQSWNFTYRSLRPINRAISIVYKKISLDLWTALY